jgi:phosphoglycolate phosphatase-like HAD superfamily hydrolase
VNTVIFDLDDTLLDSYGARVRSLAAVFTKAGVTGLTADAFLRGLRGAPFNRSLEELRQSRGLEADLFISYRRAYWLAGPGHVSLYPGVREMLDNLKSAGCRLGIVTNKGRHFDFEGRCVGCLDELEEVGIARLFDTIIGFEDVTDQKPHPLGINLALRNLHAAPPDALVVGDSPVDIMAAKSAGCRSCRALWGIAPDAEDDACPPPDFTAAAPGDVVRILAEIL